MHKSKENKELNDRELCAGNKILHSLPRRLIVTLSTRCNVDCIMCEVHHKAWDIPKTVIEEIKGFLPFLDSILWQGGEVFMLDFFEDLFIEASRYPALKQTIVTNAQLLDEEWMKKLVKANLELAVSVDGTTKELYESIRKGSSFDVLCRKLKALDQIKKRSKSSLDLRMHVVIMRSNYRYIEEFIEFAKEFNFTALHMMPIWGKFAARENIFSDPSDDDMKFIKDKLHKVSEKAKIYNIEFLNSLPVSLNDGKKQNNIGALDPAKDDYIHQLPCLLPWQQLNIDPGGAVRPGCLCSRPIGSVGEQKLIDLWNSTAMQQYRQAVLDRSSVWCREACFSGETSDILRKV